MNIGRKSVYGLMALGGLSAMSSTAIAEQAQVDTNDEKQLEVVIVTAQKQSQSIQDVAASIAALGSESLKERGISSIDTLQYAVPGVQAGSMRQTGGSAISIRGVGFNLPQSSPGVSVNVNGIYQTSAAYGLLAQLDLERIEVLRGPQGTLYGRNANGGAINFITRTPQDTFGAEFLAGYAEYDESHLQAIINAPITEGIRSRVALDYNQRGEGFVENKAGGQDLDKHKTLSGRAALSFDLTPDAVLDLGLSMTRQTGPTSWFQLSSLPSASAVARNPFLGTENFSLEPRTTVANDPTTSEQEFAQATAALTWDLGFAELKSLSGYTSFTDYFTTDADAGDVSAYAATFNSGSNAFSQEINLNHAGETIDWVMGVFYLNDNAKQSVVYNFPQGIAPLPANAYLDSNNPARDTEVRAVFGDGTWHATDKLNVIVGMRYSEEDLTYSYLNELGITAGGNRIPLLVTCPLRTDEATFSSFTPRVGLQYLMADDQNFYATLSKGVKSGGVNVYSCNNEFNPEKITAYEAGYRSQWHDGGLTFNASAFYYNYSDLQLNQIANLTAVITNAAAAEVKGLEAEMAWRPDEHWRLNGNVSLLDATYSDFANLDTLDPAAGLKDVTGNYLNNSPQFSANLGVSHASTIEGFGRLIARGDLSYRSKVYFREFNASLDGQDAYTIANLALIWEAPDDDYSIRLYTNNVTDEAYITRMGSADVLGARFVTYNSPRQIGVEFRAKY
jgi:iron complex outermembrane receptor protein